MQNDINALSNWCDNNSLSLNIAKCFTLSTTLKPNPTSFNYTNRDATVTNVEVQNDLGVTLIGDNHTSTTPTSQRANVTRCLGLYSDQRNVSPIIRAYCDCTMLMSEVDSIIAAPCGAHIM